MTEPQQVQDPTDGADGAVPVQKVPYVTIDSASTKDIDDAIYFERLGDGFRMVVAIADPTRVVQPDSTEDVVARRYGQTTYVREDAVRPMLPRRLSEGELSLIAGRPRDALLFEVRLDAALELAGFTVSRSRIKVAQRLSYADIPTVIADAQHPLSAMMGLAATLTRQLLNKRRQRGALAFYDLQRLLLADEEGNLRLLQDLDEVVGNIIVQESMILTNACAARFAIDHDIPCLYRNHQAKTAAPRTDQLADTINGWLAGQTFDLGTVREHLFAVLGRANYGAHVLGHYGLCLPAYLHITSPLRRYADLVNMRQFHAFLSRTEALPQYVYTPDELGPLAEGLNETIARRKEERSEGFKATVERQAERALEMGSLRHLAEHELRQAVKLAPTAGYLPEALAAELIHRMDGLTLTDGVADAVVMNVPVEALSEPLRAALSRWLQALPAKAVALLLHAQQSGFVSEFAFDAEAEGTAFAGHASLVKSDGTRLAATGQGPRKRDAEQRAATALLAQLLRLPGFENAPLDQREAVAEAAGANNKGRLLELCQKHGWPMVTFTATGKGPSNAMIFSATAAVTIDDVRYEASAEGGATKKEAESLAARELYPKLKALVATAPSGAAAAATGPGAATTTVPVAPAVANATDNAINKLQEIAQKHKHAMPLYTFTETKTQPPSFTCEVTLPFGARGKYTGTGKTKQEAKLAAATAAYKAHVAKPL